MFRNEAGNKKTECVAGSCLGNTNNVTLRHRGGQGLRLCDGIHDRMGKISGERHANGVVRATVLRIRRGAAASASCTAAMTLAVVVLPAALP